jgi:mannose-1-phosphate guanylyltransferase
MEGAQRVAVIPAAGLGWSDVGSWDALYDVLPADSAGNRVYNCQHLGLDTSGALVYGQGSSRLVVTIGMQDLIVVDTGDVLLICPADQAQQVRQVVARLADSGHQDLL